MNRIITILVTIFILLLLYIWISHVWGAEKANQPHDIVESIDLDAGKDLMADADTAYTSPTVMNHTSDPVTETNNVAVEDEYKTERTPVTQPEEKIESPKKETVVTKPAVEEKKKEEPKAPPVTKPKETKTETKSAPKVESKPVASSTGGKHLVIAGNFTQLENAQQRVKELQKAGYQNIEIIRFDLSEYHTVCAGRYGDVNEARRIAKKLKDYNKIDAYVRIGG